MSPDTAGDRPDRSKTMPRARAARSRQWACFRRQSRLQTSTRRQGRFLRISFDTPVPQWRPWAEFITSRCIQFAFICRSCFWKMETSTYLNLLPVYCALSSVRHDWASPLGTGNVILRDRHLSPPPGVCMSSVISTLAICSRIHLRVPFGTRMAFASPEENEKNKW